MSVKANKKYHSLRGRLIACGFTLRSWALSNGYPPTTVYGAARGERAGVEATRILRQLEEITHGK